MQLTIDGKVVDEYKVLSMTVTTDTVERVNAPSRPTGSFTVSGTLEGIWERCCRPDGPLMRPTEEGSVPVLHYDFYLSQLRRARSEPGFFDSVDYSTGQTTFTACGMSWTMDAVLRFLHKFCTWHQNEWGMWCLLFNGAKSRGKGNKAWYGSFWTCGKSVRAHKFFAVAILGLRPPPKQGGRTRPPLFQHALRVVCSGSDPRRKSKTHSTEERL